MNDQVICPNCKKSIPLTQALSGQLEEKYRERFESEKTKQLAELRQKFITEKQKLERELELRMTEKVKQQMSTKLEDVQNESSELKTQNKELQEQFLDLSRKIRLMKTEKDQMKIELEKKISEEEEKIRIEAKKSTEEEFVLKLKEKDKRLDDVLKINDELKRKLEQGSQQLQGEVLELQIEQSLRSEFPFDEILPVPKGVNGADIMQIIKNNSGKKCGVIIWETKRTKSWSEGWIEKLKQDQRAIKAELAVIISLQLPEGIKNIGCREGVWIGNFESIIGLAYALRSNLIQLAAMKLISVGKKDKMEVLYNYLSGTEFKQRVESIIESFSALQEDLEKEKRWFQIKWSKQEKNLRRVIDGTLGMHGDLQGIIGKELSEIEGVEMLSSGENSEDKLF